MDTLNEKEKLADWVRFVKASQSTYKLNALRAVYENDGKGMLEKCLRELGLERSVDLILQAEALELIR